MTTPDRPGRRSPVTTTTTQPTLGAALGRGVVSGLAGTVVMTAWQKAVEMPLTGRKDSYAPARFAEKVLPLRRRHGRERKRVNQLAHFGIGAGWGAAYGVAAHRGLSGQRAVAAVFAVVYTGDVLLNTALGLYKPWRWSRQEAVTDVVNKLVQAEGTAAAFEAMRRPATGTGAAA